MFSSASHSILAYEYLDHRAWPCFGGMPLLCWQSGHSAGTQPVTADPVAWPPRDAMGPLMPALFEYLETRCQPEVLVLHLGENDLV